jgi:hypothetical protein
MKKGWRALRSEICVGDETGAAPTALRIIIRIDPGPSGLGSRWAAGPPGLPIGNRFIPWLEQVVKELRPRSGTILQAVARARHARSR